VLSGPPLTGAAVPNLAGDRWEPFTRRKCGARYDIRCPFGRRTRPFIEPNWHAVDRILATIDLADTTGVLLSDCDVANLDATSTETFYPARSRAPNGHTHLFQVGRAQPTSRKTGGNSARGLLHLAPEAPKAREAYCGAEFP
jgi:hypothetical protein